MNGTDAPGLIGEVIYAFEESCQSTTPQQRRALVAAPRSRHQAEQRSWPPRQRADHHELDGRAGAAARGADQAARGCALPPAAAPGAAMSERAMERSRRPGRACGQLLEAVPRASNASLPSSPRRGCRAARQRSASPARKLRLDPRRAVDAARHLRWRALVPRPARQPDQPRRRRGETRSSTRRSSRPSWVRLPPSSPGKSC